MATLYPCLLVCYWLLHTIRDGVVFAALGKMPGKMPLFKSATVVLAVPSSSADQVASARKGG